MKIKSIISVLFLLFLSGCAICSTDDALLMRTLPQHYDEFDMKLAWEVRQGSGVTEIEGVVKNIRFFEMDDVEIWVISLDAAGQELHRAVDFVHRLGENETARFKLTIPQTGAGSRLRFRYQYIGSSGGGDSGGALFWRQSFESAVP